MTTHPTLHRLPPLLQTLTLILTPLLFFLLPPTTSAAPDPSAPPNIIFIMVDDMGPADPGCYGSTSVLTPNIDRLAADGIRFTQAYAGCSVCAPTRSTLMTGTHMGHTTVRANPGGVPLLASDVTIAQILKRAGYATGGFGKWGIGDLDTPGVPERHGFDRFFGYYHQLHAHEYFPTYLIDTGKKFPLPQNDGFYPPNLHKKPEGPVDTHNPHRTGQDYAFSPYLIFDQMTAFIRANKDHPFFCYAPWTIPHARYEIPASDPAWQLYKDKPWPMTDRLYAAYCSLADRLVGQTMALLKELNLDDHTIVFFCSDNGAANPSKILNSTGGLRGEKGQLYEGGIRIPLIARWPGHIPPHTTSDTLVYHPDILPTLADLAHVPPSDLPKHLDGLSLLPELTSTAKLPPDRYFYWEWNGDHFAPYTPKFQAVRHGPWKLVRHQLNGPWELYNLHTDPSETTNLAPTHPDLVTSLSTWITQNRQPHLPQLEPQMPKGQKWR